LADNASSRNRTSVSRRTCAAAESQVEELSDMGGILQIGRSMHPRAASSSRLDGLGDGLG